MGDAASRARFLLGTRGSAGAATGLESSATRTGPPGSRDAAAIARQLELAMAGSGTAGVDPTQAERLASSLVEQAQSVVTEIENGAALGSFSDAQLVALESVIRTRGRPALSIDDNGLEPLDDVRHPGSGFWRIPVNDHEEQLLRVAAATGAVIARDTTIGAPPIVIGTAWLVAPGLVITNRHVLMPPIGKRLAQRSPQASTRAGLSAGLELVVDFAHQDGTPRDASVKVTGVEFVSEDADPIDVAILRIASMPAGAVLLPLIAAPDISRQLFLCGHPGAMTAVPAQVQAVFGTPNGRKRVCFGELLPAGPAVAGELAHDASTIGGFSGSCVQAFGSPGVSALHYYGDPVRGNRAITADALRAHAVAGFF